MSLKEPSALATTPPNLPHGTTGHPYRGMSVSVRLDGALTRVGRVRWMGCEGPHRPRARASLCRRVRLREAVRAGPHCIHALAILAMTSNRVNV